MKNPNTPGDGMTHGNPDVNAAMRAWVRACANPKPLDVQEAVVAGLLEPSTNPAYRYTATPLGRQWLLEDQLGNGATVAEAHLALDHIDGA